MTLRDKKLIKCNDCKWKCNYKTLPTFPPTNDKLQMRISIRKCEKSLDEVLAQKKMMKSENFNQGCRLFADLTSGLTYLHNLKIIHHNLKSSNILMAIDSSDASIYH